MYYYLYKITNLLNNKVYIGQSNKEKERWRQHKYFGRNPEKTGQYIHRAMNKYGIDNFSYEVMAMCLTSEDANETEIILINQYNSRNNDYGYNIAPGGEAAWNRGLPSEQQPMYGKKQSDFFKQRMSEVHNGKKCPPHTDEWKLNQSKIMTGRIITDEWKEKIAIANKDKIVSKETKQKISIANKGKILTESHKDKISKSNLGKVISEEAKIKLSISNSGENSSQSKLNWIIINNIREDYMTGNFTQKQLGKKYNISSPNICFILNNKTWVSEDFNPNNFNLIKSNHNQLSDETKIKISKSNKGRIVSEETKHKISIANKGKNSQLNWDIVSKIREDYAAGILSQKELSLKYGVVISMINRIINNKKWII